MRFCYFFHDNITLEVIFLFKEFFLTRVITIAMPSKYLTQHIFIIETGITSRHMTDGKDGVRPGHIRREKVFSSAN